MACGSFSLVSIFHVTGTSAMMHAPYHLWLPRSPGRANAMDKLFDRLLETLPAATVPALLAAALAFFGVYYYFGLRSYSDVLHHRIFWSAVVLIGALFALREIHGTREPRSSTTSGAPPILLVPDFEDDERGQFKDAFIQQVQSVLQHYNTKAEGVVPIHAFIGDIESARLTATSHNAIAIVYGPRVVRIGDKIFICIRLLLTTPPTISKVYPLTEANLDKTMLDDIRTHWVRQMELTVMLP